MHKMRRKNTPKIFLFLSLFTRHFSLKQKHILVEQRDQHQIVRWFFMCCFSPLCTERRRDTRNWVSMFYVIMDLNVIVATNTLVRIHKHVRCSPFCISIHNKTEKKKKLNDAVITHTCTNTEWCVCAKSLCISTHASMCVCVVSCCRKSHTLSYNNNNETNEKGKSAINRGENEIIHTTQQRASLSFHSSRLALSCNEKRLSHAHSDTTTNGNDDNEAHNSDVYVVCVFFFLSCSNDDTPISRHTIESARHNSNSSRSFNTHHH